MPKIIDWLQDTVCFNNSLNVKNPAFAKQKNSSNAKGFLWRTRSLLQDTICFSLYELAVLYLYWYCIILVSPFNLLCYMFLTQMWRPLHLTHQKLSQMHHITLHSRQVNPRFYTKMGKLNINLKYTWTFETIAKFQDINFSSTINPNETSKKKWS